MHKVISPLYAGIEYLNIFKQPLIHSRMNVNCPKFVFVTHAQREFLYCDTHLAKAEIERKDYSQGELGLLHPTLMKKFEHAFSPQKKGETMRDKLTRNMNIFSSNFARQIYRSQSLIELYVHTKGEVPVILYDKGASQDEREGILEENIRQNPGYFIAPMLEKEFQVLKATAPENICCEIHGITERMNVDFDSAEIERSMRWLLAFDTLMHGAYTQLPIEVTRRKRTQEEARKLEKFYRSQNATHDVQRRSWAKIAHKSVC